MELKRIAVSIRSDQLEEVENWLKGSDVLGISVDYIIGSRMKYAGADVVVARQIRKGEQTLTLRSVQGISRWSRGE